MTKMIVMVIVIASIVNYILDDRFTALANETPTNPGLRNPHR